MKGIRDAFNAELSLKDAGKYWSERSVVAGGFATLFALLFVILSSLGISHSFKKGPELYTAMTKASGNKELSLVSFAVFTFPVVVFLWVLKAVSRVFVENLHIQQNARYKNMLITTYLSMLKDEITPITPQERHFALSAIFNADLGEVKSIAAPTDQIAEVLTAQNR